MFPHPISRTTLTLISEFCTFSSPNLPLLWNIIVSWKLVNSSIIDNSLTLATHRLPRVRVYQYHITMFYCLLLFITHFSWNTFIYRCSFYISLLFFIYHYLFLFVLGWQIVDFFIFGLTFIFFIFPIKSYLYSYF